MIYFISMLAVGIFIYGYLEMKKGNLISGEEELGSTIEGNEEVIIHNPLDHEKLMEEIFDQEEFLLLRKRVEDLEGTLFQNLLSWQEEKEKLLDRVASVQEENVIKLNEFKEKLALAHQQDQEVRQLREPLEKKVLMKKEMPPHIRAVVDYEKEGKTVQEIAALTKMNKGEVLLLRSLSKHYEA